MCREKLAIEVCYAPTPLHQERVFLHLGFGSLVEEAIAASCLLQKYPEIDLQKNKIGIYGKLCKMDTPLVDNDRVEIYRPLTADPKEVRKRRAAEGKVMKKGAGD